MRPVSHHQFTLRLLGADDLRAFRDRRAGWPARTGDDGVDPAVRAYPPRIEPELYAPLLVETATAIRAVNPEAKILFGGLSGAWDDAFSYLEEVYRALDALDNARPFDYFAIHPYFDDKHGLDPNYLLAEPPTILTRFTQEMALNRDGHKPIWVTEIGWNSAAG